LICAKPTNNTGESLLIQSFLHSVVGAAITLKRNTNQRRKNHKALAVSIISSVQGTDGSFVTMTSKRRYQF
jgi:hypothetical protein